MTARCALAAAVAFLAGADGYRVRLVVPAAQVHLFDGRTGECLGRR